MKKDIRIIIAEDHNLVRIGYVGILEKFENFYIVGDVENGQQLIDKYFEYRPDIVLADISMPVLGGLDAIKRIKRKDPSVKAIILSMYTNDEYIYQALKIGVKGFLSKSVLPDELRFAIKKVYTGEKYYLKYSDQDLFKLRNKFESVFGSVKNKSNTSLTFREEEIIYCIGKHLTSQQIADKLGISKRTVDGHRSRIMDKLNILNLNELISYSYKFVEKKGFMNF